MKKCVFGLIHLVLFSFLLCGCGGGGGGSSTETTTSDTYTLDDGNHALMGPLANANVKIYRLTNLDEAIYSTTTDQKGKFDIDDTVSKLDDNELVLVIATGGEDIDADDDGIEDDTHAANLGSIHGITDVKSLKKGRTNITLLSEIIYQYVRHLLKEINMTLTPDDFKIILDEVSSYFIDGNYTDIISFNPLNETNKSNLKFKYNDLVNGDDSLASIYHDNATEKVDIVLNHLFLTKGIYLDDAKWISYRNHYKVVFYPSENGNFTFNNILFDSNNTTWVENGTSFSIALNNIDDGYKLLKWNGCDDANETVCIVNNIDSNRLIMPVIVPSEIKTKEGLKLVDITGAYIDMNGTLEENSTITITVFADLTDDTMKEKLSDLKENDIVISKNEPVFFAQVVNITKVNDYRYDIEIQGISLEDVITDGYISISDTRSGYLTNTDSYVISRSLVMPDGTKISFDPNLPPQIKIEFVNNRAYIHPTIPLSRDIEPLNVKLDEGIYLNGTLTVTPKVDFDMSWSLLSGLESLSIETGVKVDDQIKLTISKESEIKKKVDITTLTFTQTVMVGPVPVVITEPIKLYVGVDGKIEGNAIIEARAVLNPTIKIAWMKGSTPSIDPNYDQSLTINERLSCGIDFFPYIGVDPSVRIYDVGLGIDNRIGPYFKLNAKTDTDMTLTTSTGTVKLSAKLQGDYGLKYVGTMQFETGWKLLKDPVDTINDYINKKIGSLEKTWSISHIDRQIDKEGNIVTSKPAELLVEGLTYKNIVINESNSTLNQSIDYKLKNIGDKSLNWLILEYVSSSKSINATLSPSFYGELEPGNETTVTLNLSTNDLSTLAGKENIVKVSFYQIPDSIFSLELFTDQEGWSKFVSKFVPKLTSTMEIKVLPDVSISKLSNATVDIGGTTVKKLLITWEPSEESEEIDGYTVYKAPYINSTDGNVCAGYALFADVSNSSASEYSVVLNSLLETEDEAKKIEIGKKYCFNIFAYKKIYGKNYYYELLDNPVIFEGISTTNSSTVNSTEPITYNNELDIVFIVDLSGSYWDDLATFKDKSTDIINAIKASLSDDVTLKIGLTSFVDYPDYGSSSDYSFKNELSLTEKTDEFVHAINNLKTYYGGDEPESQLEALYQTITLDDMGWNDDAIKIILLFTDASFHDSDVETTYPGHGSTDVKALLDAKNIAVIGMASGYVSEDLEKISNWVFQLSSDSSEVVDKIKSIIAAIPGTKVSGLVSSDEEDNILNIYRVISKDIYLGEPN